MKTRIILIALAAAIAAPASASAASLPGKWPSRLIVPGQSAGGVSLGETAATAIRAWGGNATCAPSATVASCSWGSDANGSDGTAELPMRSARRSAAARTRRRSRHRRAALSRSSSERRRTSEPASLANEGAARV